MRSTNEFQLKEEYDVYFRQVASVAPGEYWVRLTGTVSAGAGSIGSFPVRVRPQGAASGVLGSVTLHYPDN